MRRHWTALGLSAPLLFGSAAALAQAPGPSEAPPGSVVVPSEGGSVVVTPGSSTSSTTYQPLGTPSPGADINAGLPSSSRPIVGDQRDGFDLAPSSGETSTVFGSKGGDAILSSERGRARVPDIHVVKRGDTLWELCDQYYGNPWQWPRIWSYNSQVANPHWIYPGDQLRMRDARDSRNYESTTLGDGGDGGQSRLNDRRDALSRGAIFLRDQGFIGDPNKDVWGQVAGANDEQMLLSEGNQVYLLLREGAAAPKAGQELTVFRSVRQPATVKGARKPPGEIVAVLGTVRVGSYDPKTRIARATITESLDVIERGAKVGPVRRRFDVVPPQPSKSNVQARILTSLYPHVLLGQNQVVFLDRGSQDGLAAGNRLFVTRRGDTWRDNLTSKSTRQRMRIDSPANAEVETTPLPGDSKNFPVETIAELRVLRAEKYSALAVVTASRQELVPGDVAVARVGQ